MSDQSIEDVLAENRDPQHPNPAELVLHVRTGAAVDRLAAADLPLVDRERGIAVIRLDPELASELLRRADRGCFCDGEHSDDCADVPWLPLTRWCNRCLMRRAARIIGGEQSDGE